MSYRRMSRRVPARTDGSGLRTTPGASNDGDPTKRRIIEEANPSMALMVRFCEQQNKLIEELTHGDVVPSRGEQRQGQNHQGDDGNVVILERFKRLEPSVFKGTTGPIAT